MNNGLNQNSNLNGILGSVIDLGETSRRADLNATIGIGGIGGMGGIVARAGEPSARWIDITPQMAREILEKNNVKNRDLRQSHVKFIARAMATGTYRTTGQTISFNTRGELVDGQHRLSAIVLANKTVRLLVVTGVSPAAQDGIDCTIPRNTADRLGYAGQEKPKLVAIIINAIRRSVYMTNDKTTPEEENYLVEKYRPGIEWAIASAKYVKQNKFMSGAVLGAMVFAYKTNPQLVDQVYKELVSGEIPSKDSLLRFRDYVLTTALHGENNLREAFDKLITVLWTRATKRTASQLRIAKEAKPFFKTANGD